MILAPWTRYLAVALVLGWAGSAAHAQEARDSAGIRIIHNAAPAWRAGAEWRLSERPILTIGGAAGAPDQIGRIAGLARLSDGRVVVADQAAQRLAFYDAAGKQLQSIGVAGPKPEETGRFRSVGEPEFHGIARLAGDSIAVEFRDGMSIVSPSGTQSRQVRFGPFAPGVLQIPFVAPVGRFDNGSTVVADYPQGRNGPAGARQWVDSASLFLADRAGTVVRPLGRAPIVVFAGGPDRPSPMEFGPKASFASSGRAVYWGFSDDYSIRVYDADWKLARIVRRAWTPRPFTTQDRDAYVDGWMQIWSKATGAEREAERNAMRGSAYPEFLPPYSDILTSGAGDLWVREPDLTGAPGCWCLDGLSTVPSRWSVFDDGGRWLGEVAMPPRFIPREIGADYVLGESRDTDNVRRAVLYRLDKPR
jgi:hypothetical protein